MSEANPPSPPSRIGDSTIASLLSGKPKPGAWRIVLQQRSLPMNLGAAESFVIGSSADAGLQLSHHSVCSAHCALTRRGDGLVLRAAPGAPVRVNDAPVTVPTLLTGGERIKVGELELRLERGEVAAKVVRRELEFSSQQEFYRMMRRELAHAPWVLLSLAAHVLLFLALFQRDTDPKPPGRLVEFATQVTRAEDVVVAPTEPPSPIDHTPEPVEIEPDLPEIDPLEEPNLDTESEPIDEPVSGVDLPTSAGLGAVFGETERHGLGSGRVIKSNRMAKDLRKSVEGFRDAGLDLAVLIDTTSSMGPLIESTKQAIDQIITDFGALVPNLKIAIVAFRDQDEPTYVTKVQDLTDDRYRILNFLDDLDANGGGDTPEAVFEAIRVAFQDLEWRRGAYRAVLLVGDAPPHRADEARLSQILREEVGSSRGKSFVSTLCVANRSAGFGDDEIATVRSKFAEIARLGNGQATTLDDVRAVGDELIAAVIGRNHRDAIAAALRDSHNELLDAVLNEKVRARDLAWLLDRFGRGRLDPILVEALVKLHSHTVAQRCFAILRSDSAPRPQREAALYVLRRTTGYDGGFDLERPSATQAPEVERLRESIRRMYGNAGEARPNRRPR